MRIILPGDKRVAILERLEKFFKKLSCTIRDFASLIETLNSICRTVPYGRIYLRDFKREKFLACIASNDDYNVRMTIYSSLLPDFRWWVEKLRSSPPKLL